MIRSRSQYVITSVLVVGLSGPLSLAAYGTIQTSPQIARTHHSEHGDAIDVARALVRSRMMEFPGLSVAVAVDGQIVWAEGFGWADIEQKVPVRKSSRFRVGSVAKPMTAALLGLAYQDRLIDLDVPVQTYVQGFPEKPHPITTRQLAGHLSGIRHYRGQEFLSAVHYETVAGGLPIFADDPLLFEPGTRYLYSSYAWNLISAVIEGATGTGFLDQMQSRVFERLSMLDTTADQNHLIIEDRVRPYARGEDGRLYNAPYVDNSYKWAGGGFVSTAEDLVRFGIAHLQPGFLEPETLRIWLTPQQTSDGESTGYGIGWQSGQQAGRRFFGHGGGSVGGTTLLRIFPDDGLVIAVISNLSDAGSLPVRELAELFVE